MQVGTTGDGGPRFATRSFDRRTVLRALYGATLGAVLAACSGNDADVFAADRTGLNGGTGTGVSAGQDGSNQPALRVQTETSNAGSDSSDSTATAGEGTASTDPASTDSMTTGTESTTTTEASSSSTTTSTTTSMSSSTTGGGSGGALPSGATMVVGFTYQQASGGKNVPPYIAVWIEDGSGNLLTTVALWYQQFGRGERWLPDLARWYNVDQDRIAAGGADTVDAISGPTREAGSYQVAWDGTVGGSPVAAGSYFVCIESARERGPYSLIRQSINLAGTTQEQRLSNDGELVNASMTVSA